MNNPPGLIVTYNPSPDFFKRLDSFCNELDKVIVVDNGSDPRIQLQLKQEAERREATLAVILNENNLGIATALNQGFMWALGHGYQNIIAFDQDSYPAPGMIPAMVEVFSTYAGDGRLAVVAPVPIDHQVNNSPRFVRPKNKLLFERASCVDHVLDDITIVITSGALYDLSAYQKVGPFQDDFFIDYVDTEYCLRARKHGYRIVVACDARLHHRLGARQKRELLGRSHYPTFHSPLRWYYISRNRIPMLRQYALRFPHWLMYEIVASTYVLLRMLLFESHKLAKLKAFFLGTLDGLRGRMGKAADSVLKSITHE